VIFRWLKSFASGGGRRYLLIDGYHLDTSIKLSKPVTTPMQGKVTLLSFCVNIAYSIQGEDIPIIQHVDLWQPDARTNEPLARCNVFSTRRGEAWHAESFPGSVLRAAVQNDLAQENSRLRRIMLAKWRDNDPAAFHQSIAEALNNRNAARINELIARGGRGKALTFAYAKSDGSTRDRKVTLSSVSGNLLRATDLEDGTVKSFRLERISNVRPA
jgi:hypothetical protein